MRAEMRSSCASCGERFDNSEKWYTSHSNYCPRCVREKIAVDPPGRGIKRNDNSRDKWELLYLEMYDKQPNATELSQFKAIMIPRERSKKYFHTNDEE